MSEQSLGEISHNRIHQMLEALQSEGMSVELFHRLRLDREFRSAAMKNIQELDREFIGDMLVVEYHPDFSHITNVINALYARSPYSRRYAYLLNEKILRDLCAKTYAPRRVQQYPLKLYTIQLHKRMSHEEVLRELQRRELLSATAYDALCLATRFENQRGTDPILVFGAAYRDPVTKDRSMLCLTRTMEGNPMLSLACHNLDYVDSDYRLLVKRKTA